MAHNPTPSNLSQEQIIQRVMDGADDRLRVDAIVTATIGDIVINAAESSIAIADQLNGNLLKVNGDGTLDVNTVLDYTGDSVTAHQGGSWSVSVSNLPVTQPISALSLPLPTGASTEATLSAINTILGSPFQVGGSIGNTIFGATQSGVWSTGRTWTLSSGTDSVNIGNFPATVAVTQSTSPWIVNASGFTQPISGTITALQGTSPWVVSGTITTSPDVNIHDGSGTSLTSTGSALDINLKTSSITLPVSGTVAATQSGTWNITNVSGTISLPTGASTGALQTSGNASLVSIDNKLTSPLTVTGSLTDTQLRASAVPISAAALPLPSGAATSVLQTSGNTSLTSIDGKIPSNLTVTSTRLLIDGSGVTQPISGSVSVSNFPATTAVTQSTSPWITSGTSTVSGTVAATQSGTWTVQPGNTVNTTAWKVDGSAVTQPVSGTIAVTQSTSPWVTSGTSTVSGTVAATQSGAWSVAVNNASGASAVNIQDGGNSITVDNGGTFAVQATLTAETTKVIGTVNIAASQTVGLSAGIAVIGHVIVDSAPTTAVTGTFFQATQPVSIATAPVLVAGAAIIGKVGIDQTTPGTTNGVQVNAALPAGTNVIGHVIVDSAPTTAVTQSGTWTVQPGNTANTTAWKVDGSAVTQPVSGTVTANAGSNLNTSLLALEAGGNLATVVTNTNNLSFAQASSTSGQKGNLILGATTTAAPTYTTAQSNPLSLTTTGALRTDSSATTQPVSGTVAATQSGTWNVGTLTSITNPVAVTQSTSPWVTSGVIAAGSAIIGKVGIDQTTPGTTNGVQVNAALPAGSNVIGHVITDSGSVVAATLSAETTKVIGTVNISASQTIGIAAGSAVIGHIIADSGSTTAVTGNVASTVADGANVTLGAKADAKSTATDTTPITVMSVLKQISASVQAPPTSAVTNVGVFAVQATLAAETTKVIGTVNQGTSPWVTSGTSTVSGTVAATQSGTWTTQGPTLTKGTQAATGYSVQNLKDAGRTSLRFYATNAAAGTTTTETAITLTKSSGVASTTTAVSFTPTSGKTFRIQNISFATRGNVTATIQTTTFNFRINTAGGVTTTSTPIVLSMRSATPATASTWDRVTVEIPDGYEIPGDGTLQWGITAASTYVTNAPTWDVTVIGYEY